MGKLHVSHRIVIRNSNDKIVSDVPADSFADGDPIFQATCKALEKGQTATFQHGARVIKKSGS